MNLFESQMGYDFARVIMRELPEISEQLKRIADAMEKQGTEVSADKEDDK